MEGQAVDPVFRLFPPPGWLHGLDELPGYDPDTHCISLTTQTDISADSQNLPVGYLGRAHPLVRRALERVRHLTFGGGAGSRLDCRVAIAAAPIEEPALLYTFLGRLASRRGRELERPVAVMARLDGRMELIPAAGDWLSLAESKRAVAAIDAWKRYFGDSAAGLGERARESAHCWFAGLAEDFSKSRRQSLEEEGRRQRQWLRQRCEEITGAAEPQPLQQRLFPEGAGDPGSLPDKPVWKDRTEPEERLAAFAADAMQSGLARSEADGALRIYRQRMTILEDLLALGTPEVVPLGLLMLLPEEAHGL